MAARKHRDTRGAVIRNVLHLFQDQRWGLSNPERADLLLWISEVCLFRMEQ
jgi:hypothetical protein